MQKFLRQVRWTLEQIFVDFIKCNMLWRFYCEQEWNISVCNSGRRKTCGPNSVFWGQH